MTSIQADDNEDETYEDEYQPLLYNISDEKAPLLSVPVRPIGGLGSPSASSLTNAEVAVTVKPAEDKAQKKKRWLSIYIMYFTMFMSAVTFSVVLSSIWPYLTEIDPNNAKTKFLGWIVAAYSFGQLIASPLFGFIAEKRPTREPLIFALILNVVFNVLYSYSHAFEPGVAGWIMLVSRAMVGFGAGTAAVVRSYVSEATTKEERTGAMAGISSAQALGFILGPALGLAFVPFKSKGVEISAIKFSLNMYTGPGFLSALLGVVNIVLLIFFRDVKLITKRNVEKLEKSTLLSGLSPKQRMKRVLTASLASEASYIYEPRKEHFDRLAAGFSIILFFVILFVFSVFETIATPMSMDEFAWRNHVAVLYNNAFFAGLAVIAVLTFIVVKFVTKKVDERVLLMVGMFLIAFGYFAILPMSGEPPAVTMMMIKSNDHHNSNFSTNYSEILIQNATTGVVGCRYPQQAWCLDVPRIYLFQYILALVLLAIGYPTASLLTYSIYSKILGPFPQGIMMGWLTAAGSLARALGPMAISALYQHKGPLITFATLEGLVGITILFLLVFSPKLVPYERRTRFLSCWFY